MWSVNLMGVVVRAEALTDHKRINHTKGRFDWGERREESDI